MRTMCSYVFILDVLLCCKIVGGSTEMGMIMTIPRGKPFHMHEDCDWIDSPARSEFLYTLPKA